MTFDKSKRGSGKFPLHVRYTGNKLEVKATETCVTQSCNDVSSREPTSPTWPTSAQVERWLAPGNGLPLRAAALPNVSTK